MNNFSCLFVKCTSLLFGLLFTGDSQSFAQTGKELPWFLGFSAPAYMEVWIETADVVDIQERVFRGAGGVSPLFQGHQTIKALPEGGPVATAEGKGAMSREPIYQG